MRDSTLAGMAERGVRVDIAAKYVTNEEATSRSQYRVDFERGGWTAQLADEAKSGRVHH